MLKIIPKWLGKNFEMPGSASSHLRVPGELIASQIAGIN